MSEIYKGLNEVLSISFNMHKISIEYFYSINKVNNQYDKIQIYILGLEQNLYINNK